MLKALVAQEVCHVCFSVDNKICLHSECILNKKRKLTLFGHRNAQQSTSIFFQKVLVYEGRSSNETTI